MSDINMEALRAQTQREDACHRRARKYGILHKIGLWTVILLGVVCLFLPIFWVWRALLWLSSIPLAFAWTLLVGQWVTRILTHEMDPLCYLAVIDELNLKSKYGTEEVMGLVADGRYKDALILAEQRMPKIKNLFIRERLRYEMLRVYFRLGDLEGMAEQIGKFEEVFEKEDPKRLLFRTYGPLIENYKSFLEGNYTICKSYRSQMLSSQRRVTPYDKVVLDYAHGVYCYYNGEPQLAKMIFEALVSRAPLTGEGRLAATFLVVIEEKEQQPVALCEIARRTFGS